MFCVLQQMRKQQRSAERTRTQHAMPGADRKEHANTLTANERSSERNENATRTQSAEESTVHASERRTQRSGPAAEAAAACGICGAAFCGGALAGRA